MQNRSKSSSRVFKILALALLICSLFVTLSTFTSAISQTDFIQEMLKDAGYEKTNFEKFILKQETALNAEQNNEPPLVNNSIHTQSETLVQLQVVPRGNGLGAINSKDGKIKSCTRVSISGCFADYAIDTNVTLVINPQGELPSTFTGCTSTSANECDVTLNSSKIVVIQFNALGAPDFATYLTYPFEGQTLPVFGSVVLQADVVSNIQTIANVTFFAQKKGTNTIKTLGTDFISLYNFTWIPLEIGDYELHTEIKSVDGWFTSSPKVTVHINESSLIPQCIDRDDGIMPFIKSNMTSFGLTYIDNCLNATTLFEWVCDQDYPSAKVIPCSLGCSQGTCIANPPAIRTKTSIAGLLGWFSSDEDTEFFHGLDSAANGKDLSASGNITIGVDDNNPYYVFDGHSYAQIAVASFPFNYPSIGRSLTEEDYNLSISLWFNTNETSGVLLGQSSIGGGNDGFPPTIPQQGAVPAIYIGYDGKLRVSLFWDGLQPGDNQGRYLSENPVNDTLWHNIIVTYTNRTEIVYLDGKKVHTREFTQQAYASEYAYTLGTGWALNWDPFATSTGWLNYKGKIDKLSIYSFGRTLSSSEALQLFSEGRAGVSPPVPEQPLQTLPTQPPSSGGGGGGGSAESGNTGGGGGGGGGSSIILLPKIYSINETQLAAGYTQLLKENDKITFFINGEKHSLTLLKINNDQREGYFEVNSTAQYAFIKENATQKFEITNDTFFDISLKFNNLIKDATNITLQGIHEPTTSPSPTITGSAISDLPPSKNNFLLWLGIAIIIMIAYFLLSRALIKQKRKK